MKKIIKFFCYIANKFWWINWSNFRFRKEERFDSTVTYEHFLVAPEIEEIRSLLQKLYAKFDYTPDGADQLWDAVLPPPYAYKQFLNNEKYKEDCDGFHSLVLQCLHAAAIPAYLTVVWARGCGHCVLVCYVQDNWYLIDYTQVHDAKGSLQEVVDAYNEYFAKAYTKAKSEVLYNCFLGYNFKKGKFYMANPEKELKKILAQKEEEGEYFG